MPENIQRTAQGKKSGFIIPEALPKLKQHRKDLAYLNDRLTPQRDKIILSRTSKPNGEACCNNNSYAEVLSRLTCESVDGM